MGERNVIVYEYASLLAVYISYVDTLLYASVGYAFISSGLSPLQLHSATWLKAYCFFGQLKEHNSLCQIYTGRHSSNRIHRYVRVWLNLHYALTFNNQYKEEYKLANKGEFVWYFRSELVNILLNKRRLDRINSGKTSLLLRVCIY